jgi:pilus assembly protein CpaF
MADSNRLFGKETPPAPDRTSWNERLNRQPGSINVSQFQVLKHNIHRKLLDKLDLAGLATLSKPILSNEIRKVVEALLAEETTPLTLSERERVVNEVLDEVLGLGPLEPLLKDPSISDILVNTHKHVYVERRGKLEKTDVVFKDNGHLMQIIDKIVSAVGRRVDESSPMVDARLADGSRVNAVIPPLALDGPILSIRRFGSTPLTVDDLLNNNSLTPAMLELLKGIVKSRLNCIISGGTGSGKTTLLNCLSGFIPEEERIVTIEDAAELQLHQEHVVRLETRPPNIEGKGAIRQRQLVINALRMRPDRIVVGEVRGEEALDMLQAMNTGHDGSLTTVHANSPRDALSRLETMISMANLNLPERALRQQIASAMDVIIQASRLSDGTRKIMSISEVVGMEGDIVTMQDVFVFERIGIGEKGKVLGRFRPTGIRPKFAERLKYCGIHLPASMFETAGEFKSR